MRVSDIKDNLTVFIYLIRIDKFRERSISEKKTLINVPKAIGVVEDYDSSSYPVLRRL